MAIFFKINRRGNDFSAQADGGPSFFVGRRVPFEQNIGLYNIFSGTKLQKIDYAAQNFNQQYGFWADFIEPTAMCEGRNFLTLNTYDSAAFTFGFGQFAAHVPDGDFVTYFRRVLGLPEAPDYFPNLDIVGGRIVQVDGRSGPMPLESDTSTAPLMKYLNPDLSEVQDAEVVASAKLIHMTSNIAAARDVQVAIMTQAFQGFMTRADKRLGIHGRTAAECCVIGDLLHHGRGGRMVWPLVDAALKSAKPFDALIAIGAPRWDERKRQLKKQIQARAAFATLRWDHGQSAFV